MFLCIFPHVRCFEVRIVLSSGQWLTTKALRCIYHKVTYIFRWAFSRGRSQMEILPRQLEFGFPVRTLWDKLSLWRLPHRRQYVSNDLKSRIFLEPCPHFMRSPHVFIQLDPPRSENPKKRWEFPVDSEGLPMFIFPFSSVAQIFLAQISHTCFERWRSLKFFPDANFSK